MTFFVDANVVIYAATESEYRRPCLRVLDAVAHGDVDGRTSPAVLEEVWYIERSGRAGPIGGLTERAYTIFAPLLPVTDDAFRLALGVGTSRLGPADLLHLGTCVTHQIETVVSADAAFDHVPALKRVDPRNGRALNRLLAVI